VEEVFVIEEVGVDGFCFCAMSKLDVVVGVVVVVDDFDGTQGRTFRRISMTLFIP
jgi:hypothetical protein